ncbi:hypothetical protein [Microbacterium sp.]|uniref:hypothetical protein n=1 Tax=Microbacterium sp. TaxID=51671 RepID=UPI003F96F623
MSDQQPTGTPPVPPYAAQQPPYSQQTPQQRPHQNAAQGYVLNGQPPQATQPTSNINPVGRAGLILGLIAIAIAVVNNIVLQVLIASSAYSGYSFSLVSGVGTFLTFAAALAALILGLIGIRRVGAPHAAAGIAVGIGIAQVVGIAFSTFVGFFGSFLTF